MSMMKQEAVREAIVREWLALAPNKRATADQSVLFAMKALPRYRLSFRGDHYQTIKGWLSEHIGLA